MIHTATKQFGRVDILVNNAGSFNFGPVHETTDAMLDEVLKF